MQQTCGMDFAMSIRDVEEYTINAFYGTNYKAVVITEGGQCGSVNYGGDDDDCTED